MTTQLLNQVKLDLYVFGSCPPDVVSYTATLVTINYILLESKNIRTYVCKYVCTFKELLSNKVYTHEVKPCNATDKYYMYIQWNSL